MELDVVQVALVRVRTLGGEDGVVLSSHDQRGRVSRLRPSQLPSDSERPPIFLHMVRLIKDAGGIPAHGNQRSEWDAGCRFDYPNPKYR